MQTYSINKPDSLRNNSTLKYDIQSISFFANKEYASKQIKGFTLGGTWIKPGITYLASDQLRLSGGFFYKHYFGNTSQDFSNPLFLRATYTPSKLITVKVGDIFDEQSHQLSEYLYDPYLNFTDPIQEGISFHFNHPFINFESWIDWEKFIFDNSPFREEFIFGTTAQTHCVFTNKQEGEIAFDLLFKHKGGEIDASPLTVQTLLNTRIGYKHHITFNPQQKLRLGFDWLGYKNNSGTPEIPISKGSAYNIYSELTLTNWNIGLYFWHAKNFFAPKADPYFLNYINNQQVPVRDILWSSQAWRKKISNRAYMTFINNVYYDFRKSKIDLAMRIQININITEQNF